jgi:hypothetical protein
MSLKLNPLTGQFDTVVKDHGLLTGLSDDDHTQYILASGTRAFSGNQSFTTQSFGATTSDKISLYDEKLGDTDMYGFGIEASALYHKSQVYHRWYVASNADGGTSDVMELASNYLQINVGNILIPTGDLHIGPTISGFEDYELTIKSSNGGMIFQRTSTAEPFIYLFNETASSGFQIRGSNSGGGYISHPSTTPKVIDWNLNSEVGIGGASVVTGTALYVYDVTGAGLPIRGRSSLCLYDNATAAKGVGGGIAMIGNYTGTTESTSLTGIKAYKTNATAGNYDYSLALSTRQHGSAQSDKMFILGSGGLLLGTADPANAVTNLGANLQLENGVMCIKETTTPTADTNYGKVYTKTDNKLYFQDGAGTEHEIAFV